MKRTRSKRHKTPSQSTIVTRYLVMPGQANPQGTAFGGAIVAWIDMVASMAAQKHCQKEAVTASIDSLNFRKPIHIGDQVVLKASVNYAGITSMEVGVRVTIEEPYTQKEIVATTAHLTFVALDKNKKPTPVPQIHPETPEEIRRYENAKIRVQARKQLLKKMK